MLSNDLAQASGHAKFSGGTGLKMQLSEQIYTYLEADFHLVGGS